jgi:tetratricopeptide (TPR) repeat protein
MMNASTTTARAAGLILASLAVLGPARAGEDDLRQRALALNAITGSDTVKGEIITLLEDPATSKKLVAAAAKMARQKPQPFGCNATLVLATVAHRLGDYEAGEAFYRLHAEQAIQLQSENGVAAAYGGLIDLLFRAQKYAETERICRELLEIDGGESLQGIKTGAFQRLVLSMAKQGQTDKALEMLDRLGKKQPDNWFILLQLKGQVLHEAGKIPDAVKTYEEMTGKIRSDKRLNKKEQDELESDVRYYLSGLYLEVDQVDKAAEQLKTLLAREPDNPTYNNDLGYIWADHDMNLSESERLIRKALEEDRRQRRRANADTKAEDEPKDNPAYLDSLAWVLYKQKKYKDALPYLQEAVKAEAGKHLEIYDHLGDVHLALGDKKDAVAAWKEAVKVAGTTKRDKDRKAAVEKKIKANE